MSIRDSVGGIRYTLSDGDQRAGLSVVIAAWDEVAHLKDAQAAIHPLGADPDAYEASGIVTAEALLEAFGSLPGWPLIDFGAGDGRVAIPLAGMTQRPIVAVDSSPAMLARLAERKGEVPNLFPMLADGTWPLPIRAAGIYAIAVLIHHKHCDGAQIILNLAASLIPGGRMILDLPLYDEPREPVDWTDVGVWTLAEIEDVATAAGLRIDSAVVNLGCFSWEAEHHHEWVVLTKP